LDQGVSLSYQWLRDGAVIGGASSASYLLVAADAGRQVSVTVTGSKAGYDSVTQTSLAPTVGNGTLSLTPLPSISGVFKVGSVLRAEPGLWDQGVSLSYQWLRNGVVIGGASSASYLLVAADAGRKITLKARGDKLGYDSISQTSSPVTPASGKMTISKVTIRGVPKVGKVLTASTSNWAPSAKLTYQWLLDGKSIRGASAKTLKLTPSLKGRKISLKITQTSLGYTTASAISAGTKVN
jgi:hypothetical protein